MMILRAEIWACNDCTLYLCNGDLSGVDYEQGPERCKEIEAGCEAQGQVVPNFDSETGVGTRTDNYDGACDFCGIQDAADLSRFAELGEGPEELDHSGAREYPIANSSEHDASYRTSLYLMWIGDGSYTAKSVYIWAESFESAFEELVEWADEVCPGYLSKTGELLADMGPEARAKAKESGEIPDHTTIGHTTLNNGDCVASWCWGGNDVTYEPTIEAVRLLCA